MTEASLLAALLAEPESGQYRPFPYPIEPVVDTTISLPNPDQWMPLPIVPKNWANDPPGASTGLSFVALKEDLYVAFEKALLERLGEADVCGVLLQDGALVGAELAVRGFIVGEISDVTARVTAPGVISADANLPVWLNKEHGDAPDFWVRSGLALGWSVRGFNKTGVLHADLSLERGVNIFQSEDMWPNALVEFRYPRGARAEMVNVELDVTRLFAAMLTEQHDKLENARIAQCATLARQADEALTP